nr:MAG TPA: hypothetical protein [Caudoviricetes sp.]
MMLKIKMFIVRSSRSCGVRAAPFSFLSRFIFSISRTRFILSVSKNLLAFLRRPCYNSIITEKRFDGGF